MVDGFVQNLRYTIWKLLRAPLFSSVAVMTLAVGIGANAAIYSVVKAVLSEPLPYDNPEELVGMWDDASGSVTGLAEPEQVGVMMLIHQTLPIVGVQVMMGRVFTEEDDSPDAPETVLLSHWYWERRFGSDRSAIGQTLTVNGRAREIIGIMPLRNAILQEQSGHLPAVPVGVVNFPGAVTLGMLEETGFAANLNPLKQDVVGDVGSVLWVLLGTVAIILLIACANVANLLIVRVEGRQREMAVRTAMGAERGQVMGLLLTESAVLGVVGAHVDLGHSRDRAGRGLRTHPVGGVTALWGQPNGPGDVRFGSAGTFDGGATRKLPAGPKGLTCRSSGGVEG